MTFLFSLWASAWHTAQPGKYLKRVLEEAFALTPFSYSESFPRVLKHGGPFTEEAHAEGSAAWLHTVLGPVLLVFRRNLTFTFWKPVSVVEAHRREESATSLLGDCKTDRRALSHSLRLDSEQPEFALKKNSSCSGSLGNAKCSSLGTSSTVPWTLMHLRIGNLGETV